ncbi:MAG: GNAT family N-acetyltransferase [Dehalococcoidia bacterium]|nr:GNAT family N-acetyltransferase [Dehalococcoidia bacterium]
MLGPWAMALVEGRVVSICHSPRLDDYGAEAGTWTDPAFRGRGYAAAATAVWAKQIHETGSVAFYSTSADNRSSQRVAERLGLELIGWLWKLFANSTGARQ